MAILPLESTRKQGNQEKFLRKLGQFVDEAPPGCKIIVISTTADEDINVISNCGPTKDDSEAGKRSLKFVLQNWWHYV